jgi:hypothetical protein
MSSSTSQAEYATPRQHSEIRLWPGLEHMGRDLERNRERLNGAEALIMGESLGKIRSRTRIELLERAKQYHQQIELELPEYDSNGPLIVTGHQCQFFHCGILIKYILIDHLARTHGGVAVNISADSDLPKNVALKLPTHEQEGLTISHIPLTNIKGNLPMEYHSLPSGKERAEFIHQMRQVEVPETISPAVEHLAKVLTDLHGRAETLADLFNLLNHYLARELGVRWLEIPLSRLGQSDAFMLFAADLICNAQQVRKCYNEALAHYRGIHKIRNNLHPMPDLKGSDNPEKMQELPLWILRAGQARMPLFVQEKKGKIFINNGQESPAQISGEELKNPQRAVRCLQTILKDNNIQIRPRALTLTIFGRLFLADYFVHGIGGARYDGVADEFMRSYYKIEPLAFATASATMHLPVGDFPSPIPALEQLNQARQRRRDLKYNPQRYVGDRVKNDKYLDAVKLQNLINSRKQAIETSEQLRHRRADRGERRRVFEEIRQLNSHIVAAAPELAAEFEKQIQVAQRQYHQAKIAHDREYFFGLFDPEMLKEIIML